MDYIYVLNVLLWGINGIIDMRSKEIKRYKYIFVWIMLMMNLIADCVTYFSA